MYPPKASAIFLPLPAIFVPRTVPSWFLDGRIPLDAQIREFLYAGNPRLEDITERSIVVAIDAKARAGRSSHDHQSIFEQNVCISDERAKKDFPTPGRAGF